MIRRFVATLAITTCIFAFATPSAAQMRNFNVPAGSLRVALDTFARQSGRQVIYRGDEVKSVTSPGVNGARTADVALDAILGGTGLVARKDRSGAFGVVKAGNVQSGDDSAAALYGQAVAANSETASSSASATGNDIVVTGSRVKTYPSAEGRNG